jgi:GGDEF domain-containing protein
MVAYHPPLRGSVSHCLARLCNATAIYFVVMRRTDDQFVIYFHRYDPETEKPVMDEAGKAITNTYLYEGRPRAD